MWPFPKPLEILLFQSLTNQLPMIWVHSEAFLDPKKGRFRKKPFREDFLWLKDNFSFFQNNLFLNLSIWYPLSREFFKPFTKMEDTMKQLGLLPLETLPPSVKYEFLFQPLPSLSIHENHLGRPGFFPRCPAQGPHLQSPASTENSHGSGL